MESSHAAGVFYFNIETAVNAVAITVVVVVVET
jgi:hypothetical protein